MTVSLELSLRTQLNNCSIVALTIKELNGDSQRHEEITNLLPGSTGKVLAHSTDFRRRDSRVPAIRVDAIVSRDIACPADRSRPVERESPEARGVEPRKE